MMSLQLRMAMCCTICDQILGEEDNAVEIALFGVVSPARLARQGICPKCKQRVSRRWTRKQLQDIVNYIADLDKQAADRLLSEAP